MEQFVVDWIELILLHEHARVPAIELQPDEGVHARFGVEDPEERLRIDRNLDGLPLLGPVHHRGNTSLRAQAPRLVLPTSVTFLGL